MTTTINNTSLVIPDGAITGAAIASNADIAPGKLAQRVLMRSPVSLTSMRVWDANHTLLPGTSATDDLGLVTGTPGTNSPRLSTGDLKAAGSTNRKAMFELEVPANFDPGSTFQIEVVGEIDDTVSDTSATVDLEVYKPNGSGGVGSDLCGTAAQSINSTTPVTRVFDITGVVAGDKLLCYLTVNVTDAATAAGTVTGLIHSVSRLCDTRG